MLFLLVNIKSARGFFSVGAYSHPLQQQKKLTQMCEYFFNVGDL